ncbi:MAG TPA: hypothetical protein DDZ88_07070 [Verrucomicrobiales bacterium]|nr:hypothetical protein [Verrucomicrobiales bacterium]
MNRSTAGFFRLLSFLSAILMKFLSRPGFYLIVLLIAAMLLLTLWLNWKLGSLPRRDAKQETAPAAVST